MASRPPSSVIGRNLLILQALAGMFRVTLTDLSRQTGLSQSTVHRILSSLVGAGLVAKDGRPGEYRLTGALGRIGRLVDDRIMILDAIEDAARAMTLKRSWPVAVGFLQQGKMEVTFSTRALTTRVRPSMPANAPPTMAQAGCYAGALHYLKITYGWSLLLIVAFTVLLFRYLDARAENRLDEGIDPAWLTAERELAR